MLLIWVWSEKYFDIFWDNISLEMMSFVYLIKFRTSELEAVKMDEIMDEIIADYLTEV